MKTSTLLILAISLFTLSCSDEDAIIPAPIPTEGNDIPTVYQPIKVASFWNYDTENIPVEPTGTTVTGQDKLLVDNDVVLNTFNYKKMKTEVAPTGFYSGMLNNNNLRIDGSSLKLTGTITANLDASLPLTFNVNDFVIFKENGVANEVLSQTSPASFTNTTLIEGATLTFIYSLKSTYIEDVASLTVPAGTFANVKKTRIEVNLEVKIGTLTVLNPQNVIISDQFYAKNIGVIKANTVVKYNLTFPVSTDVPQNGEQHINDFLSSYTIN